MYEAYYKLKGKPFGIVPNPEAIYMSPKHKEALTYLEYGLLDNIGTILFTGVVGIGKTTLLRYVLKHYCESMVTVVIFNTNLTPEQLIETLLQSLRLPVEKGDRAANLAGLEQFLLEQVQKQRRVLFIIDEAQNLSREALEEVRMLSNLQTDEQMLSQIMLVGQPELRSRIKTAKLAQFAQRIAVNYHLEALDQQETIAYIGHRLENAGRDLKLFDTRALEQIYQASCGIPRNINMLCDAALVYGFGYELQVIGPEIIDQVLADKDKIGLESVVDPGAVESLAQNDLPAGEAAMSGAAEAAGAPVSGKTLFEQQCLELLAGLIGKVENFGQKLAVSLTDIYLHERKRNEQLLAKCQELSRHNFELRKQLKGMRGPEEPTDRRKLAKG